MATPLKAKGGRELSARGLEALADQAAAGFDLATWRRLRVGRPLLEPSAGLPTPRIAVHPLVQMSTRK
jgi:hypothetical protein